MKQQALTLERRINRVQRTRAVDRATAAGIVLAELNELRAKGVNPVLDEGPSTFTQIVRAHDDYADDVYLHRQAERRRRLIRRTVIALVFVTGVAVTYLAVVL